MSNIVVKAADGTTDKTFALVSAGSATEAAQFRQDIVGIPRAFHPVVTMIAATKGNLVTAKTNKVWPVYKTIDGVQNLQGYVTQVTETKYRTNLEVDALREAITQFNNIPATDLVKGFEFDGVTPR